MNIKIKGEGDNLLLEIGGMLGSDPIIKSVQLENDVYNVAVFTLAEIKDNKVTKWHDVQLWEDKFPKNFQDIKKGDLVELKGYNTTFKVNQFSSKTIPEFVTTEVLSHKIKNEQTKTIKESFGLNDNIEQDQIPTKDFKAVHQKEKLGEEILEKDIVGNMETMIEELKDQKVEESEEIYGIFEDERRKEEDMKDDISNNQDYSRDEYEERKEEQEVELRSILEDEMHEEKIKNRGMKM